MPIRDKINAFDADNFDPATFDAKAFKAELLSEFDHDETAWKAAVATRDTTISKGAADLQAAQSKAWELLQQVPAGHDVETQGVKPDEDSLDDIRSRVFTTD